MNPEIKKLWLTALKSGEYKKGKASLKWITNSYCCLGVLCDLYRKEKVEGEWILEYADKKFYFKIGGDSLDNYLPDKVQKWAGLDSHNPKINWTIKFKQINCLAQLNDETETFDEVIKVIEEQF